VDYAERRDYLYVTLENRSTYLQYPAQLPLCPQIQIFFTIYLFTVWMCPENHFSEKAAKRGWIQSRLLFTVMWKE